MGLSRKNQDIRNLVTLELNAFTPSLRNPSSARGRARERHDAETRDVRDEECGRQRRRAFQKVESARKSPFSDGLKGLSAIRKFPMDTRSGHYNRARRSVGRSVGLSVARCASQARQLSRVRGEAMAKKREIRKSVKSEPFRRRSSSSSAVSPHFLLAALPFGRSAT